MAVELSAKTQAAERLLREIGLNTGKAIAFAVKKAMEQSKVKSSRIVREDVNLKAGFVKKGIRLAKKPKPNDPNGRLEFSSDPVLLRDYGAKTLKRGGVSVKVSRSKKPQKLGTGFITTNNKFVFIRGVKGKVYPDIKLLYGPDIGQIIEQELKTTDLEKQFADLLEKTSRQELKALADGVGPYAR